MKRAIVKPESSCVRDDPAQDDYYNQGHEPAPERVLTDGEINRKKQERITNPREKSPYPLPHFGPPAALQSSCWVRGPVQRSSANFVKGSIPRLADFCHFQKQKL